MADPWGAGSWPDLELDSQSLSRGSRFLGVEVLALPVLRTPGPLWGRSMVVASQTHLSYNSCVPLRAVRPHHDASPLSLNSVTHEGKASTPSPLLTALTTSGPWFVAGKG